MSGAPGGLLRREANRFLLALAFLSRLPVLPWARFSEAEFGRCARWFVPVGLLLGGLAALPGLILLEHSPWLAVWTTLAASLLLTGSFHEDGLADTFDGLGGGVDRERKLAIMKDSRLGTYGAAALFISLQIKASALVALGSAWPWAFVAAQGVSRGAAVALMALLPEARADGGKPKPNADREPVAATGYSLGFALLIVLGWAAVGHGECVWLLPASAAVLSVMRRVLRRQIGGYTGDGLGATQQLSELAGYVALVCFT